MEDVIKIFISALKLSSLEEDTKQSWIETLKSGKFDEEFANKVTIFLDSEREQVTKDIEELKKRRDDLDKQIAEKKEENQEKKIILQDNFRKELKEIYNEAEMKIKGFEWEIDVIKEWTEHEQELDDVDAIKQRLMNNE